MTPLPPPPAAPAATHLLYLHGFRSSPASFKARRMAQWVAQQRPGLVWACPQLPPSPAAAWALMQDIVRTWPRATTAILGSSLGGFYATALSQHLGCRAVLVNPAVDPARDLAAHIGRQTMFHDPSEAFFFQPAFIDELKAMAPPAVLSRPLDTLALVATGDEVLDWHEMAGRYRDCRLRIIEGSDHGLSDFEDHLPLLLAHLGLTA